MTQEIRDAVARAMKYATDVDGEVEFRIATAALTALSACEPTPEMVEAAARACLEDVGADPDVFIGINGQAAFETVKRQCRAAVSAALKMVGK